MNGRSVIIINNAALANDSLLLNPLPLLFKNNISLYFISHHRFMRLESNQLSPFEIATSKPSLLALKVGLLLSL